MSKTTLSPSYSPVMIMQNQKIVKTSRIFTSLVGGCAAGIAGISGWWQGFLVYILVTLFTSFLLACKADFNFAAYFVSKHGPVMEGLFSGFMTFIMFWTLMYDVAHVYSSE